jgi:hypothetical protein
LKKVYASQSAFMKGTLVFTRYASGCLRSILLSSKGVREQIQQKHQDRGKINEDLFEETLKGRKYEREKPIFDRIIPFDDTFFSARADYFFPDDGPTGTVVELKSSESSSVLNDVIRKGKYKLENVAQLIAYMLSLKTDLGKLNYTFLKPDKKDPKVYLKTAERLFNVQIGPSGAVLIDGDDSGFTAQDQLDHRYAAAKCMNDDLVWSRPYQPSAWESPCRFCPFSKICDKWDAGEIDKTEDFISQARNAITGASK